MKDILIVGALLLIGLGLLVPGSLAAEPTEPAPVVSSSPQASVEGALTGLTASLVVAGLHFPTDVLELPGSGLLLVAEKPGRVVIVEDGRVLEKPLLDISDWIVETSQEQGLLSIEAHPDFVDNDLLYLFFTDLIGDSQLVEVEVLRSGSSVLGVGPPRSILQVPQRHKYHQSGSMVFGPDGYLWVSIGDGGGIGDPEKNGQNPATLKGTIIRLDLSGRPYSIPSDNPFFDLRRGGRPEVWAYGLRNPWRISIDHETGLLYVPDVGQETVEEINIVTLSDGGTNFGWSATEGTGCFREETCDPEAFTLPVLHYLHKGNGCAIVGGQVYRGAAVPELHGHYFYADFCRGWIRSLLYEGGLVTNEREWESDIGKLGNVTSFGTDTDGEMFVTNQEGQLWKIIPIRDSAEG